MAKSDAFENDLLKLIFQATPIANMADNAASAALSNLHIALHTASPGEDGTQATNEVAYTGYARVSVVRSDSGWTVTANSVSPAADIVFPACTGGTATATHWSVGVAASGSTKVLYKGAISPTINIANGTQPRLTTTTAITEN